MNLRNRFLSIVALNAVALLACAAAGASEIDPYERALADVANAPEYCVVVFVEPDATHGWRAVCDLLGNDDGPTTIRDRAGSVVYESTEAESEDLCYFEAGETICPLVITASL